LLKNFHNIKKLPFSEKIKKLRPLFGYRYNQSKSSYSSFTREEQYQIDNANKFLFNRIKNKNSVFKIWQWEKDYQQSRLFLKNICEYPSIDFHKSIQRKIEKEKSENQKNYYNTTVNFYTNLFKKTKFKNVKLYRPKEKKNDVNIDNEHFNNGENEKEEEKEFALFFIVDENTNKKIKIEKCKKSDNFMDIIDKVCENETGLNKDKIKMDEFTIKGRTNGKEYIDYNDTLQGNRLEGNEEIIIKIKKEE
jgi:hypothetical protein